MKHESTGFEFGGFFKILNHVIKDDLLHNISHQFQFFFSSSNIVCRNKLFSNVKVVLLALEGKTLVQSWPKFLESATSGVQHLGQNQQIKTHWPITH